MPSLVTPYDGYSSGISSLGAAIERSADRFMRDKEAEREAAARERQADITAMGLGYEQDRAVADADFRRLGMDAERMRHADDLAWRGRALDWERMKHADDLAYKEKELGQRKLEHTSREALATRTVTPRSILSRFEEGTPDYIAAKNRLIIAGFGGAHPDTEIPEDKFNDAYYDERVFAGYSPETSGYFLSKYNESMLEDAINSSDAPPTLSRYNYEKKRAQSLGMDVEPMIEIFAATTQDGKIIPKDARSVYRMNLTQDQMALIEEQGISALQPIVDEAIESISGDDGGDTLLDGVQYGFDIMWDVRTPYGDAPAPTVEDEAIVARMNDIVSRAEKAGVRLSNEDAQDLVAEDDATINAFIESLKTGGEATVDDNKRSYFGEDGGGVPGAALDVLGSGHKAMWGAIKGYPRLIEKTFPQVTIPGYKRMYNRIIKNVDAPKALELKK